MEDEELAAIEAEQPDEIDRMAQLAADANGMDDTSDNNDLRDENNGAGA